MDGRTDRDRGQVGSASMWPRRQVKFRRIGAWLPVGEVDQVQLNCPGVSVRRLVAARPHQAAKRPVRVIPAERVLACAAARYAASQTTAPAAPVPRLEYRPAPPPDPAESTRRRPVQPVFCSMWCVIKPSYRARQGAPRQRAAAAGLMCQSTPAGIQRAALLLLNPTPGLHQFCVPTRTRRLGSPVPSRASRRLSSAARRAQSCRRSPWHR